MWILPIRCRIRAGRARWRAGVRRRCRARARTARRGPTRRRPSRPGRPPGRAAPRGCRPQDPPGVGPDDVGVDLGVLLPGVADQNERQLGVQVEDLPDAAGLLLAAGGGAEQVAQQHRAHRESAVPQKRHQEGVQVPGARGDVKDRIHPGREVAVQVRCTRERRPREGGAGERLADHPTDPLDAGLKDRVVDVGEDPETCVRSWDPHLDRRGVRAGQTPVLGRRARRCRWSRAS